MPRWAEIVVLMVIGLVVTVGIMVYAKYTTQEKTSQTQASASSTVSLEAPTASSDSQSLEEVDRAAAKAVANARLSPPEVEPKSKTVLASEMGPPLAAMSTPPPPPMVVPVPTTEPRAERVGPPLAVAPKPTGPVDELEPATESNELDEPLEADEEKASVTAKKAKSVAPGSEAELAVLLRAQKSLRRLHALKLRGDVAPAASQEEARRLTLLLNQLAPKTRAQVQALIDKGYNARNRRIDLVGKAGAAAVQSHDLADRQLGKFKDTPSDVRAIRARIESLRGRLGLRAAPAPPGGGVNASSIPSVAPSTLPQVGAQGLPSVQPSSY